jgi:hypothetical protein
MRLCSFSSKEADHQAAEYCNDANQTQPIDQSPEKQGKDPAAAARGRKGGQARAKSMSPERRTEIARKAARKRWHVQNGARVIH